MIPRIKIQKRAGGDGIPEVYVSDEQDDENLDLAHLRSLALATLAAENVRGRCELSLFLVDRATIADMNAEHMGKSGPTDVLSFPLDGVEMVDAQGPGAATRGPDRPHPDHDDMPLLLGDVMVCPSVAREQCATHAGTFEDEMALLVVHGVLHVLGHDHAEPDQTVRMRDRELEILTTHHWQGPAPAGFRQEQPE